MIELKKDSNIFYFLNVGGEGFVTLILIFII